MPHPSTPFFSRAFGLALTADRPVPGLISLTDAVPADTRIWLDAEAMLPTIRRLSADLWYASEETEMSGVRMWKISGGEYYRLLYSDGTEFFVQGSGTDVWAAWPGSSTIDDTATYLLGPVLAFVLGLRGVTCLHGSVVAIADRAVVFAGPSASGKSTLAAAFARLGHTVLSDDIAVLAERDGVLYVDPAHPQIRLWSDSVELLFGAADALPCLTANWDKRGLDLIESGYSFAERPLPLAAVYILDERSTPVESRIDSIKGRELLRTLLANTYVGYMLDVSMRSQDFATLSRLAAAVPVRRLHISGDPRQVCVDIIEDCEALGCTASPITGR